MMIKAVWQRWTLITWMNITKKIDLNVDFVEFMDSPKKLAAKIMSCGDFPTREVGQRKENSSLSAWVTLQYDRKHREIEFQSGQWVWLRLLHRLMASLEIKGKGKLGPKFNGPFKILERVGDVAYKLQLPAGAKIHDVFPCRPPQKVMWWATRGVMHLATNPAR
jgi:hypothetical protein